MRKNLAVVFRQVEALCVRRNQYGLRETRRGRGGGAARVVPWLVDRDGSWDPRYAV